MSDESLNRFDRIVAILIQLQSKRIVKAQELADRFNVSLRTVYRDVRTLEASGVPIISEAGVGYSIMDGYRLPPVMFTREEAASFLTAEKLMKGFTDKSLEASYETAMIKIRSVLRGAEKDMVETLDNQIQIRRSNRLFNEKIPNVLEVTMHAIADRRQVELDYEGYDKDKRTQRVIEPIGLFHENNHWYVSAYCCLRDDYRHFRADRILGLKALAATFSKEHGPATMQLSQWEPSSTVQVRLRMPERVARYVRMERKYYGFREESLDGEEVEMIFDAPESCEGIARWFLMFADHARIIEPQQMKDRVKSILDAIQVN